MYLNRIHVDTSLALFMITGLLKIFSNYFNFLFCGQNWGEKRNELDEMFSQHILTSPEVQEEEQSILHHILEMPIETNMEQFECLGSYRKLPSYPLSRFQFKCSKVDRPQITYWVQ